MFGPSLQNLRLSGIDPRGDHFKEPFIPLPLFVPEHHVHQHPVENPIKKGVVALCTDSDAALAVLEAAGIAATVCSAVGGDASNAVPFLGLIATPIYLHHAVKKSFERFKLMVAAAKVRNISSSFFWAGRGLDSFGIALGNTSKTVAGALELAKISSHAVAALLMLKVIPITLIVIGALGGIFEAWALSRNVRALSEFNRRAVGSDRDLDRLVDLLKFLEGPAEEASNLDKTEFQENFFSKDTRMEEIHHHIKVLFDSEELKLAETMRKVILSSNATGESALESIGIVAGIMEELTEGSDRVKLLHRLLALKEEHPEWLTESQWGELETLQERVLAAGTELTETMRSDIQRAIFNSSVAIILSILSVASGSMVMTDPNTQSLSNFFSISGGAITISLVVFDKTVDQKRFHRLMFQFQRTRKVRA